MCVRCTCTYIHPGRKNAVFRQMIKNQSIVNYSPVLFTSRISDVVREHEWHVCLPQMSCLRYCTLDPVAVATVVYSYIKSCHFYLNARTARRPLEINILFICDPRSARNTSQNICRNYVWYIIQTYFLIYSSTRGPKPASPGPATKIL